MLCCVMFILRYRTCTVYVMVYNMLYLCYITRYVVLYHMLCYVCYITRDVCVMFYNMSCYSMLPAMLCYITLFLFYITCYVVLCLCYVVEHIMFVMLL